MFIKTVKYDLLFSKTVFLSMAGIIIALAAASRLGGPTRHALEFMRYVPTGSGGHTHVQVVSSYGERSMPILFTVGILAALITMFQVMAFFHRNFFEDTGYLMLTLPARRFTLLCSKLTVAVIWFNFMLLAAAIALILYDPPLPVSFHLMGPSRIISLQNLITLVEVNIVAMSIILTLFFIIVLARCSIWNGRIGSGIAAVVGVLLGWALFWVHIEVGQRHREWVTQYVRWEDMYFDRYGEYLWTRARLLPHYFRRPIVGIDIGRIPVGDGYIDIYRIGVSIIVGVLAFWAALYLLERRVSI